MHTHDPCPVQQHQCCSPCASIHHLHDFFFLLLIAVSTSPSYQSSHALLTRTFSLVQRPTPSLMPQHSWPAQPTNDKRPKEGLPLLARACTMRLFRSEIARWKREDMMGERGKMTTNLRDWIAGMGMAQVRKERSPVRWGEWVNEDTRHVQHVAKQATVERWSSPVAWWIKGVW